MHDRLVIPDGDVVIHAGDATWNGSIPQIVSFSNWFRNLPHRHKIFVPGNHDKLFESDRLLARSFCEGFTCLMDQELIIEGVKFYGAPWTPKFALGWAFNLERNSPRAVGVYNQIPDDVNVLITHGPPHGILDRTDELSADNNWDRHAGCEVLARRLKDLEPFDALKLHVFGHIHEGAGVYDMFVNASMFSHSLVPRTPIVVDL